MLNQNDNSEKSSNLDPAFPCKKSLIQLWHSALAEYWQPWNKNAMQEYLADHSCL